MDVALSISEGLARNVLAAEVNGEIWDANRILQITLIRIKITDLERREKQICFLAFICTFNGRSNSMLLSKKLNLLSDLL